MILMLFSALISVFSVHFFILNFSIQGLNRAIINTPNELMYIDVVNDNGTLLFNVSSYTENLKKYYDNALLKYVKSYDISLYFYDKTSKEMCESNYCDGVEITVTSKLTLDYTYTRTMFYEIRGQNG